MHRCHHVFVKRESSSSCGFFQGTKQVITKSRKIKTVGRRPKHLKIKFLETTNTVDTGARTPLDSTSASTSL